jgi:hypothetical protein
MSEQGRTHRSAPTRRRGMDLGRVLLWSAVIVEAPRWAGAMLAADLRDVSGWLSSALNTGNTLSGIAMGVVNVVATAYLLDALRRERPVVTVYRHRPRDSRRGVGDARLTLARPNWRFYGILVFVVGLLGITPFVLAPFMVSRMTGDPLAVVLRTGLEQYAWAVTVVLAPIFVIGGVSFAQPGLVTISQGRDLTPSPSPEGEGSEIATSPSAPRNDTAPKWRNWRRLPEAERRRVAGMDAAQVREVYGVEERTAYNWVREAKAMFAEAAPRRRKK